MFLPWLPRNRSGLHEVAGLRDIAAMQDMDFARLPIEVPASLEAPAPAVHRAGINLSRHGQRRQFPLPPHEIRAELFPFLEQLTRCFRQHLVPFRGERV